MSLTSTLEQGLKLHRSGDLTRAAEKYTRVLRIDPGHGEALHLMGFLEQQRGRVPESVAFLERAVAANPRSAVYRGNLGSAYKLAGRRDDALAMYREAIRLKPDLADAHYNLGLALDEQGERAGAIACYQTALRYQPNSPEALNNLGNALSLERRFDEAEACFVKAISLQPANPQTHHNFGVLLLNAGRNGDALQRLQRALELRPDALDSRYQHAIALLRLGRYTEAAAGFEAVVSAAPQTAVAWAKLGLTLTAAGRPADAIAPLDRSLSLAPGDHETWNVLGLTRASLQDHEAAAIAYERAVALAPAFEAAWNSLALARQTLHRHALAIDAFDQVLAINPGHAEAAYNRANSLRILGRISEALAGFDRALELRPDFASAHLNRGTVLEQLGRPEEARASFVRAAECDPRNPDPHTNLGLMAKATGDLAAAIRHFDASLAVQEKPLVRIFRETLLPPIYDSEEQLVDMRRDFSERLDRLLAANLRLDPDRDLFPSVFYLPYQGFDDRELQEKLARLYARATGRPDNAASVPSTGRSLGDQRLIRIGFVSRFFYNHTISRLTHGLVAQLPRDRFDVHVLSLGAVDDEMHAAMRRAADSYHTLCSELPAAREQIRALNLDILFYTDIGMDPFTYSLAFTRLAPLQCVTWGHPVTTGIDTIDCFLSSELIEPPGADSHYTERLVQLPHLPVYYEQPRLPAGHRGRRELGLFEGIPAIDDETTLYLCPQSLFKFHPQFDAVIGEILTRDPRGVLLLVAPKHGEWVERLRSRFQQLPGNVAARIRFVPGQTHAGFLELLAAADVMLDPLHFGGGNTSFEALGLGLPIVTCPSEFMRGRVTLGCYRQMGLSRCIASNREEYVDLAVRLGTDRSFRDEARREIEAARPRLFANSEAVHDLARFLEAAVLSPGDPVMSLSSHPTPSPADHAAAPTHPAASPERTGTMTLSLRNDSALPREAEPELGDVLRSCTCPACGHHVAVPFFDGGLQPLTTLAWPKSAEEARAMKRLPHNFLRCVDCGHVYNADFSYDEVPYSEKPNLMFNKGIVWREHLAAVRDLILSKLPANPVVVEIGCGEGHLLRGVAERCPGGRFIGFDPNGAIDDGGGLIEARRELFEPHRHLAELRPHLIVSRHVLEHLMNPLGFVQALGFAASWEGVTTKLLIEVPCIDGVLTSGRTVDFFYEHNSHFTSCSLERLLTRCAANVELVETGYHGEVVYGLAEFRHEAHQVRLAREAARFRARSDRSRESLARDLDRLVASGRSVAIWGGTGKAAAFINQNGLDAVRFPTVVDSDPDKAGTYVPGTGQLIQFRDCLKTRPTDVILIATQWRAHDITLEIDREGIRYGQLLIEHDGRLVDFLTGVHPYRTPRAAA